MVHFFLCVKIDIIWILFVTFAASFLQHPPTTIHPHRKTKEGERERERKKEVCSCPATAKVGLGLGYHYPPVRMKEWERIESLQYCIITASNQQER